MNDNNIEGDSYTWNMIGSMFMAFQSVLMLMVIMRTVGVNDAGVFSIAFASANLFLTIGKFGMRNFQVSDIENKYDFNTYKNSRIITTLAMILLALIYTIVVAKHNKYSSRKILICIWMCIMKAVDSIEDVYHGELQRKNRLDIASKAMSIRIIATIIVFIISLVVTKDFLCSLIVTTLTTIIIFAFLTCMIMSSNELKVKFVIDKNLVYLIKATIPLGLSSFLAFYISNAPKYAIDRILNDELQACYGFIAMPVFIIGLLNSFIFNPMLFEISKLWNDNNVNSFIKKIGIQVIIIAIITVICLSGAYILGIPVLSFIYNFDLSSYKCELLILILGGGFLGLSGLFMTIITIIREQRFLLIGYIIVAMVALISSEKIVIDYGITGACWFYLILMIILSLFFMAVLFKKILKK